MTRSTTRRRKGGFTLPEVMTAAFIGALVAGGVLSAVSILMLQTRAGVSQVRFIQEARRAQQWMVREVQRNKYFEIHEAGQTLFLYSIDNALTQIRYVDEDGDARTVEDNRIELVRPNGDVRVLCGNVSRILGTQEVFRVRESGSTAVMMAFQVGDSTAANAAERRYETGPGYQGLEIRMAATPRNLQRWYD
jgi:prepilin-type N-terminal cleavage/methylation domain-containing protein